MKVTTIRCDTVGCKSETPMEQPWKPDGEVWDVCLGGNQLVHDLCPRCLDAVKRAVMFVVNPPLPGPPLIPLVPVDPPKDYRQPDPRYHDPRVRVVKPPEEAPKPSAGDLMESMRPDPGPGSSWETKCQRIVAFLETAGQSPIDTVAAQTGLVNADVIECVNRFPKSLLAGRGLVMLFKKPGRR